MRFFGANRTIFISIIKPARTPILKFELFVVTAPSSFYILSPNSDKLDNAAKGIESELVRLPKMRGNQFLYSKRVV
jgi:hypothetical protein